MAGLESATYINQLNPLNPSDTLDYVSTGDDHIRLIKSTVQNTFTRITGPVSASDADLTNTTYLADTGTVNQIVLTFSPVWASYVAGKGAIFKAANTNTGAVTVKVNSLTAVSLLGPAGNALAGGEIIANGIYRITYDGASFRLASCDGYIRTTTLNITPYTGTNAVVRNGSTGSLTIGTNGQNNIVCAATGATTINTLSSATATVTTATIGTLTVTGGLTVGGATMPFPSGTRLPFAQASAPTGWTQDTSDNANNRMLRVVNTAGGGVAGTHSPILNNVVPAHTHSFTTGGHSADHTHSYYDQVSAYNANARQDGSSSGYLDAPSTNWRATTGVSANHTHSGSTDNGSSQTNWAPRYINMIICTKN